MINLSLAAIILVLPRTIFANSQPNIDNIDNSNISNKKQPLHFKATGEQSVDRQNFYKFENEHCEEENERIFIAPNSNHLRIGYFDAHLHGLSLEDYLDIFTQTHSNLLIARGLPHTELNGEREGSDSGKGAIKEFLMRRGFHSSTLVYTDGKDGVSGGMIVGVKCGDALRIQKQKSIFTDSRQLAAIQFTLEIIGTKEPTRILKDESDYFKSNQHQPSQLTIIVVVASPGNSRRCHLGTIQKSAETLQIENKAFMIVGGFWREIIQTSPNSSQCLPSMATVREAWSHLSITPPSYTSFLGMQTDTFYLNNILLANETVSLASIYHHARVDTLPILLDTSLGTWQCPKSRWHLNAARRCKLACKHVNWKIVSLTILMISTFIVVFCVVRVERAKRRRRILQRARGTGHAAFSDYLLKRESM